MFLLTNLRLAFTRILSRPRSQRRLPRIKSRRISAAWVSSEQLEERVLLSGAPLLRDFTVMSQNLYLGTDLNPIITAVATGDPNLPFVVGEGWQQVVDSMFLERADTLAEQILESQPDIIGLQEVALWQTGPAFDPAPATDVEFDFLEILLDELSEHGLHYTAVAVSTNFAAEVPGFTDLGDLSSLRDIRLTDRDVILARTDLKTADLKLSNAQAQNFETNLPLPPLGEGFELTRGWTSVDVKIRGNEFRVLNTHLELEIPPVGNLIQVAQTQELLAGPANTDLPVILLGDFNAQPDPLSFGVYQILVGAGFDDVWTQTHPGEDGFTCCHDADLRNELVDFQEGRIDWVLYRGDFLPLEMDLFNDELSDRTPSGLWVSDHAGLVASLIVSPLPPVVRQFSDAAAASIVVSASPSSDASAIESLVGSAALGVTRSGQLPLDHEEDDRALEIVFRQFPLDDLFSPPDEESEEPDLLPLESSSLVPA